MVRAPFVKYHGLGNDFVVVDARASGSLIDHATAVRWCDRHRGIGADGVLTLLPPRLAEASVRMHIYNADGSSPEMCGNGLRCVVRHVLEPSPAPKLSVDTDAGLREGSLTGGDRVRVTLGRPEADREPITIDLGALGTVRGLRVSMGNPHFVLTPISDREPLHQIAARLGPTIEHHRAFPDRTNVELIRLRDGALEVVVWERGVGITMACGTGAGAAAIAARRFGLGLDGVIRVQLLGGPLDVSLGAEADPMVSIEGEAVRVFEGVIEV